MLSWQNILLYIGLAAVIFFILKAFTNNLLTNSHIIWIVLIIMVLVILLLNQCTLCTNNKNKELFKNVGTNYELSKSYRPPSPASRSPSPSSCPEYLDEDLENLKDEMEIDHNKYWAIKNKENQIKRKIRQEYTGEMPYTTTNPINTVPLGSKLYDYTYLPPENWFRAYEQPPVCITDNPANISSMTDPTIKGLVEFDTENMS